MLKAATGTTSASRVFQKTMIFTYRQFDRLLREGKLALRTGPGPNDKNTKPT
jgi:hypothetical protein